MVLQQGIEAPIWGTADAGEDVVVTIGSQKATAKADASGKWATKVGPLKPGEPLEVIIAGKNRIALKDVLVGEVWVCSGQSNMEWNVNNSANVEQERAQANYPGIRMFTVNKAVTGTPAQGLEGSWAVCTPQTVGGFSAVGYFFGRELHKSLNVPVGLIHTSWGGTPAESWTERSALEADPDLRPILERWDQQFAKYQQELPAQLAAAVEKWKPEAEKADAAGRTLPPVQMPQDPRSHPWRPAGLYNAMIAPLLPYGIKGAIWYQGESNAGRAYQYRKLLPAMIQTWRKGFNQGDFPFLIVSLANFTKVLPEPGDSDWAELREAQTLTANNVPNAGQAITIDIGEAADIHPKNKQDVGRRLALAALAKTYQKDVPYGGPVYDSMSVEGDSVRLKFKHAQGGLMAKSIDGPALRGFAIAGEDRKWHWADAKIDPSNSDTVLVRSDKVAKPVAVRYAWANNPVCNLYNQANLPAVPFRTDDWKGVTADAR
jgi:sialate O-acetylesterase